MSNGNLSIRDYTSIAAKHAYRDARRRGRSITWKEARALANTMNMLCSRPGEGFEKRVTGQAPGDLLHGVLTRDVQGKAAEERRNVLTNAGTTESVLTRELVRQGAWAP